MKRTIIKRISLFTLLCFVSLIYAEAFPQVAGQEEWPALVAKGEADYGNGLFQEALASFTQALGMVQKNEDRENILLAIALAHFALKNDDRCAEALRALLRLNPERQLDMRKFPEGFNQMYGRELWQVQQAMAEQKRLDDMRQTAVAAPGLVEKTQPRAKLKKKKFPWLWVLLGAGVVVGVVLLLTKKKKPKENYILTVTVGEGVSGTPASGEFTYEQDTLVNYSYTPAAGFISVEVKLDGNVVGASGSLTMDGNHALEVSARSENYDYDTRVLGITWMPVAAGTFEMGDPYNLGDPRELPVHTVDLDAYSISKTEVTFAQYDKFCTETGRKKPSDGGWGRNKMPVFNVSWIDAKAFCDWLAAKTGKKIHLPTEAQWERAAAGTDKRKYPWGSASPSCSRAVYSACTYRAKTVGSCPAGASAAGALDMAGNVWEWCQDWAEDNYYQECANLGTVKNPLGPESGSVRVLRGGSFTVLPERLRCSFRDYNFPNIKKNTVGFRIALDQ